MFEEYGSDEIYYGDYGMNNSELNKINNEFTKNNLKDYRNKNNKYQYTNGSKHVDSNYQTYAEYIPRNNPMDTRENLNPVSRKQGIPKIPSLIVYNEDTSNKDYNNGSGYFKGGAESFTNRDKTTNIKDFSITLTYENILFFFLILLVIINLVLFSKLYNRPSYNSGMLRFNI
jgi:hypothetical protein